MPNMIDGAMCSIERNCDECGKPLPLNPMPVSKGTNSDNCLFIDVGGKVGYHFQCIVMKCGRTMLNSMQQMEKHEGIPMVEVIDMIVKHNPLEPVTLNGSSNGSSSKLMDVEVDDDDENADLIREALKSTSKANA